MAFNAADLLHGLFPESARPAVASTPGKPQEPQRHAAPAASPPAKPRPASRLPGALPPPPVGEWLSMWRRAPQVTLPPKPCGWCGGSVFWHSTYGAYHCGRCHPPAFPALAAMWLQVVATEDGPQVVRLGGPPSTG